MANVKISNAPPFGLPTGATLTGAEFIPMDQTVGGIVTTIKATISQVVALATGGVSSVLGTANQIAVSTVSGVATISFAPNLVIPAPGGAGTVALTVNAAVNNDAIEIFGSSTSGQSFGLFIGAGTTSADYAIKIQPHVGGVNYMQIKGDGSGTLGPSGSLGLSWTTTGALAIAAPTTGAALTVTANAASQIGIFNGPAGNSYFDYQRAGTLVGRIGTADSVLVSGGAADFAISAPNGNVVIGAIGSTQLATISNSGTFALNLTTPNGGPWALQLTRADLGTSIHCFNNNNQWYFNEPVNCQAGLLIAGVAVSFATTGSFTAGTTGLSGATIAAKYTISGNSVTLFLPTPSTNTSSATNFVITGLPAAIQPSTAKYCAINPVGLNTGSPVTMSAIVSGSTITLQVSQNASGWTASGVKTYGDATHGSTFTYTLD